MQANNVLQLSRHLRETGDVDSAAALILASIGDAPDYAVAHLALAEILLTNGDYGPGFREYEWRRKLDGYKAAEKPPITSPFWNGMKMESGRLLVLANDQGYGDAVMFSRFIPMMRERVGHLVLAAAPPIASLFDGFPGVDQVISNWKDLTPHAAHLDIASAPYVLDIGSSIPPPVPFPGHEWRPLAGEWDERVQSYQLRVGIAWSGSPAYADNERRSIPPKHLVPLAEIKGVEWVCLQTHIADEDKPHLEWFGITEPRQVDDFSATLREMAGLDAVVTIDTSLAHLAGVLGIPTMVALHHVYAHSWPWGTGDSTPWYPGHKIVRQTTAGDWKPVIACVDDWIRSLSANSLVDRLIDRGIVEHG